MPRDPYSTPDQGRCKREEDLAESTRRARSQKVKLPIKITGVERVRRGFKVIFEFLDNAADAVERNHRDRISPTTPSIYEALQQSFKKVVVEAGVTRDQKPYVVVDTDKKPARRQRVLNTRAFG